MAMGRPGMGSFLLLASVVGQGMGDRGVSKGFMDKHLFPPAVAAAKHARCLDGTPAGFYYRAAATDSDNVVFFMQGGGACNDTASCAGRINSTLGGSTHWKARLHDGNNFVSSSVDDNPYFHDWHHFYIPYCSGDVHTGQWTSPDPDGLYFMGHHIVRAVAEEVKARVPRVARLMVSGDSAGGIGAIANVEFLSDYFHETFTFGVPQAGLFFPNDIHTYSGFLHNSTSDIGLAQWKLLGHRWKTYGNKRCIREHPPPSYHCFDAWILVKYITVPMFYMENQFDTNQIFVQLGCPKPPWDPPTYKKVMAFVKYNGERMRYSLRQNLPPTAGIFSPACLNHTGNTCFTASPVIRGRTIKTVFGEWYEGLGGTPGNHSHQYIQECPGGTPCSTTCGTSNECFDPY